MSKSTKALLYNFLGFTGIYVPTYLLVMNFTNLIGLWIAGTAFMISLLIAPKYQAVTTKEGEKLFVKWLFVKGVKEVN